MLLGKNETPFPDNPHCQRCASKNCRELLVQPLFPGKVIFAHRRHFCSIPDYIPSWRNEENPAPAEETALTDELEVVSGPVTVSNPRWEHKDEAKKESSPDAASFDDTIILRADVTGMPEQSGITFDIYETSEMPPMCIATAKGKIEKGVGKGEWVLIDKSGKGAESKLAFEAIAKSKASEKCEINLTTAVTWGICYGPDKEPLALRTFSIFKDNEQVFSGTTDKNGTINVPFEHSPEYQLCVEEK